MPECPEWPRAEEHEDVSWYAHRARGCLMGISRCNSTHKMQIQHKVPSSQMYGASVVFDGNLITTRTINSNILLTWAAADSWQSLVSLKVHCSAFQTRCSCGPYTANPATVALWLCRHGAPAACVFECGPTREEDLQTELWHRKPETKRTVEVSTTWWVLLWGKQRETKGSC